MQTILEFYWKNNFLIGTVLMETVVCCGLPLRRRGGLKWLGVFAVMLVLSASLGQLWQWDSQLIAISNILTNVPVRVLLVGLSIVLMTAAWELEPWNAAFIAIMAVSWKRISFNLYKVLEELLLGPVGSGTPGPASVCIELALLLATCAAMRLYVHRKELYAIQVDRWSRNIILLAFVLAALDDAFRIYQFTHDPYANVDGTMIVYCLYDGVVNGVIQFMLYNLIARRVLEAERLVMESLARQQRLQYRFSQDLMDSINIKSHDLKKQLTYLRQESAAGEYLAELETAVAAFDSTIVTASDALSTVLTEKALICHRENIPFTCAADGDGTQFIRDLDLYTLFANLLDNAIEASMQVEEGRRSIGLTVRRQNSFLSIHAENRYEGELRQRGGSLLTTKSDTEYHGFGMKSMKQLVERYEGVLGYKAEDGVFSVNILIPIPEEP